MTEKIGKKRIGRVIAVALLAMTLVVGLIPNQALAAETKIADPATIDRYLESLGDEASTEYAGRIWTDKTVYAENTSIPMKSGTDLDLQISAGSDFAVMYSALATGVEIDGMTTTPMDIVFVIDMSSSMINNTMDNRQTRLYNATVALNDAMKSLVELNDHVRVGVISYNRTGHLILPLDHYAQYNNREFFTCRGNTITINADGTKNDYNNRTISTQSGTNIQKGIFDGLNMLASADDTTVEINGKEVQRVPSLVLLTDGEPSNASNFRTWWDLSTDTNNMTANTPAAIYGMKALMTASYMKDAVDRNYGGVGASAVKVYSIGVGIENVNNSYRPLAYATINPNDTTLKNHTNSMVSNMRTTWNNYANNRTATLGGYTFNHPTTGYDIIPDNKDISGLYYVDNYYSVENSESLTDAFVSIVTSISLQAAESPTELKHADPSETGHIYYTDPIGGYMEVKDVKGIIYKGVYYDTVAYDAEKGTYTVSGTVENELYKDESLSDIDITLTGKAGVDQQLKIDIPASLIPMRINSVELNADGSVKSHTNNASWPIRVIYEVGLVDGVTKTDDAGNRVVDTTKLSAAYVEANTDAATGNVNFYSNLYTKQKLPSGQEHEHTIGNATAVFEPAHTNSFYYMQEDDAIYKLSGGNYVQVTASEGLADDGTYYYVSDYYHGTFVEKEYLARTGEQLKKVEIVTGEDGYLYRKAGSPRLNRILEFAGHKNSNATNTAEDFYFPTFEYAEGNPDPFAGKYVVHLGNNGKLSIPGTGALEISKTVTAAEGLTAPDAEFEFTVDFNGSEVVGSEFDYVIVGTETTGTIKDGDKLTLTGGQTARITGLAPGTTYDVTEVAVAGFATQAEGASGTITAGEISRADFVNNYHITEPLPWPTEGTLSGTKTLVGREWSTDDQFTFFITPYNNAPLPTSYDAAAGVTVNAPDVEEGQTASFEFGTIEFTKPGVYRYTLVEKEPENNEYLPGMSYSRALYRLVVTVVDNGDGTLSIDEEQTEIQKLYTDNGIQLFSYNNQNQIVMNQGEEAEDKVNFTNTFSADDIVRVPVALKDYTDNSGEKPLVSGMFNFKLKAVGSFVNGDDSTLVDPDQRTVPMPEGSVDDEFITENEGHNVTFPGVTFSETMIPDNTAKITFRYEMSEVQPANPAKGMTYDSNVYTIDVEVYIEDHELVVNAKYPNSERIVAFKNTYTPEPVMAHINGSKTLTGRDMKSGETFEFKIAGADAATNLAVRDGVVTIPTDEVNVSGGKAGKAVAFAFENIEFTKAGTYKFAVTETPGSAPSVTYDDSTVTVTVVVEDTGNDGALDVKSLTYSNSKESADFVNKYTTEFDDEPVSLSGTKNLTGKSLLDGEFFFNVVEYFNGDKVSEGLVSHTADTEPDIHGVYSGLIEILKNKTYSEPGTYEYYITEQIPNPKVGGTTYDESEFKFTVVVKDVEQIGELKVTSKVLEKKDGNAWVAASEVVFNNVYTAQPATAAVPVMHKVVSGYNGLNYPLKGGEFKFCITGEADGMVLPVTKVVTNDAEGMIHFDDVTFTKAGTYVVTVTEVVPDDTDKLPGMTYTTKEVKVTFTVTDNRTGQLSARVSNVDGERTFVNDYTTTPADVELEIEKNFTGREWQEKDSFDFEVEVLDQATQDAIDAGDIAFPMDSTGQKIEKKTIDQKGETITGKITVNTPGTYKFIVRELTGIIPGVHYDSTEREITIVATDNQTTGKIETEVTIMNGTTEVEKLIFNNVYDATSTELSGHDHLTITKVFTGRENEEWLDDDKFTFTLDPVKDYGSAVEMPARELVVTNANKAHPHFGNIIFREAGEYKFVVKEVKGDIPGVIYDEDSVEVTVVVTNNTEKGALEVTSVKPDEIKFVNEYVTTEVKLDGKENLDIVKQLTGRDWFDTDDFEFTLSAADLDTKNAVEAGTVVLPDEKTLIIDKNDAADGYADAFGDITFKAPGVYNFEIVETEGNIDNITYDTHNLIVEVTVEDNQKGALVALVPVYYGSNTFENVYTPGQIQVPIGDDVNGKKELNGRALTADEFEFELVEIDANGDVVKGGKKLDAKNDAEGKISFGNITYSEAGTHYYKITEKAGSLPGIAYDEGYVIVTVDVTYNSATGELSAVTAYAKFDKEGTPVDNAGFTFKNDYTSEETEPVDLSLVKTVTETEGNAFTMEGDEFEFIIEPASTNPDSDPFGKDTKNVKNGAEDANGEAVATIFDGMEFTEVGNYVYTIYEGDVVPAGFSKDASVYTVIIAVTDDESIAKLQRTVTITKDGEPVEDIKFNNSYNPTEATLSFSGKKTLDSEHKAIEADKFQFQLTAVGDAPMPAADGNLAKNNETGHFQFGTITYVKPGNYEYRVSEVDLGEAGYSYDTNAYTIKVEVKDVDGILAVTTTGYLDDQGQSKVEFINGYVPAPDAVDIGGIKKLMVPEGSPRQIKDDEFTFILMNGSDEIATTKNIGESFVFEDIPFDKAGTYNYKIVEENSNIPGVTDDPQKEIRVAIEVSDIGGALEAVVSYPDYPQGNPTFTNSYVPLDTNAKIILGGVKVLEGKGNNGLEGGDFTFQLKDEAGVVIDTASNDKNGAVNFKEIKYNAEGVYKYTISEVKGTDERIKYDDTVYEITVNVKDGGEGYLVVDVQKSSESILFTNYYDAPEPIISIVKTQAVNGGNATTEKLDVEAGDEVMYYLQVANAEGSGIASNLTVTDKVPAGLEVVEISGNGIERNGEITWHLSDMIGGDEPVTVWFKVKVPAVEVDTEWENVATVAYDDPNDPDDDTPKDPNKEEPSNPVEIEEDVTPVLTVEKEASKTEVKAGDEVTYTITVKNTGDGKAENVVVTDILPEGLIFVGADKDGAEAEGIVTWNIGDLAAGAQVVVSVTVEVPEVDEDTSWQNVATATYNEPGEDPKETVPSEPENIETDVNPVLTVVKVASKAEVKAGDEVTYTITVKNIGDGKAEEVVITDILPEGLIFVGADNNGVEEEGIVTWNIGDLAAGAEVVVNVTVEIPEVNKDTNLSNIASVTYKGDDEEKEPVESNPEVIIIDDEEIIEDTAPEQEKPEVPEKPEPPKSDSPDTGDQTNILVWLMLLGLSGAGLAGTAVYKRRRG